MSFHTTFNTKTFQVKPPDKGSFPLDHEGECRHLMVSFMRCLQKNDMSNSLCREESKAYLQCRMDRNLMAKENWSKLGYTDENNTKQEQNKS